MNLKSGPVVTTTVTSSLSLSITIYKMGLTLQLWGTRWHE